METESAITDNSQKDEIVKIDSVDDGGISIVETEEIEGGNVKNSNEPIAFQEAQHKATTTRRLANWLIIILAGSIVLQYACTMWLELKGMHSSVESLDRIFNSLLPVVSGLAGSAITYYFTKDKTQ